MDYCFATTVTLAFESLSVYHPVDSKSLERPELEAKH
jgi:hypothetical protein